MKEIRSDPFKSDNCMKSGHLHGNLFPLCGGGGGGIKTQVEQICFNFILIRVGESELPLSCKKRRKSEL